LKTMQFIPELKNFLRKHGEIYTVRQYGAPNALIAIEELKHLYKRERVKEIKTWDELAPYVPLSGFGSLEDWRAKINSFIPSKMSPKHLYHVSVTHNLVRSK